MDFGMPFLIETPTIEASAALCRDLGLDFVELNLSFPACSIDRLNAAHLMDLQQKYGIYFTMHLDEELAPCAFTQSVRSAYVQSAVSAITLARTIGTPSVNLHWPRGVYITLPERVVYMFESYREDYLRCTREFRDACAQAADGKVRICIENTDGFRPFQQEAIDLLLEDPAFGLTLDIGHDYTAGRVDDMFYRQRAQYLHHMHAHDSVGKHCHMAFGTGEDDVLAQLKRAQEAHARVVIEVKTIAALTQSVQHLHTAYAL